MADLVVLGFDNRRVAEEVFDLGASLQGEELLDLQDAALAWRDDKGRVRIHQALPTTATGAEVGAFSGAVFALIRRSTPDRVTEALKQYHPTVLHTNLTKHREEDLVKALQP